MGGRRVSGSGAGWVTKNDVKTDDISLELKYTDKKSYPLREEDLITAERHAMMDSGREFGFMVQFTAGRYPHRRYVVISEEYFEELRGHHGHSE
jgi:hypothetical protein